MSIKIFRCQTGVKKLYGSNECENIFGVNWV